MKRKTRGERLLKQFEKSARLEEIKFSMPPSEIAAIDLNYRSARQALLTYINLLESLYANSNRKESTPETKAKDAAYGPSNSD